MQGGALRTSLKGWCIPPCSSLSSFSPFHALVPHRESMACEGPPGSGQFLHRADQAWHLCPQGTSSSSSGWNKVCGQKDLLGCCYYYCILPQHYIFYTIQIFPEYCDIFKQPTYFIDEEINNHKD